MCGIPLGRRASRADPLSNQADGNGEVEIGPRPINSQYFGGDAANGQRQATSIAQRECPGTGQRAQSPGELGVRRAERFDGDTSRTEQLA